MESNENILTQIDSPDDLRQLSVSDLPQLCQELRDFIIKELSENPGHLAASLGTVELTVALHYTLNTPEDTIVWDVGHQAYGHKILTGRREQFHTNRKKGGISGFPHPKESPYDSMVAGHASNSISAALGIDIAQLYTQHKQVVAAVIGDGAMSGGLAFEGLNNCSEYNNNLLIILNDNKFAIDKNVGGLSRSLARINTSQRYNNLRWRLYLLLKKIGLMSDARKNRILRFSNGLKGLFNNHCNNLFDGLDIRYFGPVDGHNVQNLVRVLNTIKHMTGPKVLHVCTIKGKGYEPAEHDATRFHAPGKFDIASGECLKTPTSQPEETRFQDVFGQTLTELAEQNSRIVGVTPAMPTGCGMNLMAKRFPDRVFDVGIAEGHAVTFSAGLAKGGLIPYCNIYSSFAQRAYDNIIHDLAIPSLPVVLCIDRAGLVGEDGVTHQGAFDLAALRCVPNLTIASPIDADEFRHLLFTAQALADRPFVIRYPRGKVSAAPTSAPMQVLTPGKGRCLHPGKDLAVLSIGPIGLTALQAIESIEKTSEEVSIALYDFRYIKPLDEDLLIEIGKQFNRIVTLEEASIRGGFGSAVMECLSEHGFHPLVKRLGLPDRFIEHARVDEQMAECGLDRESLQNTLLQFYQQQA